MLRPVFPKLIFGNIIFLLAAVLGYVLGALLGVWVAVLWNAAVIVAFLLWLRKSAITRMEEERRLSRAHPTVPTIDPMSELISADQNRQKAQLPVPRWLLGVPLILVVLGVIMFAGGQAGPLSIGIFILGIFVFGYLYIYMIGVWRQRRPRDKP